MPLPPHRPWYRHLGLLGEEDKAFLMAERWPLRPPTIPLAPINKKAKGAPGLTSAFRALKASLTEQQRQPQGPCCRRRTQPPGKLADMWGGCARILRWRAKWTPTRAAGAPGPPAPPPRRAERQWQRGPRAQLDAEDLSRASWAALKDVDPKAQQLGPQKLRTKHKGRADPQETPFAQARPNPSEAGREQGKYRAHATQTRSQTSEPPSQ
jgi:hypothetical protein